MTRKITVVFLVASAVTLRAGPLPIVNDAPRFDTDGNEIRCQGGSMMKLGDTWYWYGIDIEAAQKNDAPIYHAVRCYTSQDLSRWKFERAVFTNHVPNRVDVVFNPRTKKYVLFTKEMNPNIKPHDKIEDGGTGVALCDTPTGDFVWQGRIKLPDSVGGGDQSVFVDDNGKTYITYAVWRTRQQTNVGLMIAELSDDYLSVVRTTAKTGIKLEAPALFKRNGLYYWMASGIRWWYSSTTMYCTAPKLDGPWTPWKEIASRNPRFARDCQYDSYNAQHDFVVHVQGRENDFFMFCGDRYSQFTKWGVGLVVWLPLTFDGNAPQLDWHRTWNVDAAKGTWSPVAQANITPSRAGQPWIANDTVWTDTQGEEIRAQGGCIVRVDGRWWWYGIDTDPGPDGVPVNSAVRCYSSTNLTQWTAHGKVLTGKVPARVQVARTAGKEWMLFLRDAPIRLAVAISPMGPFAEVGSLTVPGAGVVHSFSVFQDDDGSAWLLFARERGPKQYDIHAAKLAPDLRSTTGEPQKLFTAEGGEPRMWKRKRTYFVSTVRTIGWINHYPRYAKASSPTGPYDASRLWSGSGQVKQDIDMSSIDGLLEVKGTAGSFLLYYGSRYSQFTGIGIGRNIMVPWDTAPKDTAESLRWQQTWWPDVARGIWSTMKNTP